jgi:hypothetical protein
MLMAESELSDWLANHGSEFLAWLGLLGAVLVLGFGVVLLAMYDRLRQMHHALRNIEHHAKHLAHATREPWRGESDDSALPD